MTSSTSGCSRRPSTCASWQAANIVVLVLPQAGCPVVPQILEVLLDPQYSRAVDRQPVRPLAILRS